MKSNHADYRVTRHQSNADQWATGGLTHVVLKKDRVFAKAHFRKKYLQLELRVGRGKVSDPDFQYWRQGESSWGYVQVYPSKGIRDKVIAWIEMAKNFVVEAEEDDENEGPGMSQLREPEPALRGPLGRP